MNEKNGSAHSALAPVVEELCSAASALGRGGNSRGKIVLPSRDVVIDSVERLRSVFFPGYFGTPDLHDESLHYYVGSTLDRVLRNLEDQIRRGIAFAEEHDFETCEHCGRAAAEITREFMTRLPAVRRLVATDVEAAYEGDPALKAEAIFSYPGVFAVTNQRIAHELHVLGVPLIPRMITEHAHASTGIDIHPGARIGERFFIDHGTGVVIGETAVIGNGVKLYQGVTLGALAVEKALSGVKRHPTLEDHVVVYSNATILGGNTVVGHDSTVGGNAWLTQSVPPFSLVTHQSEVRQRRGRGDEELEYNI